MSVDNFAILAFVDPIGIVTTPSGVEICESQGHGSLDWTPGGIAYDMADPISKPAWRYTIGSTPKFWLILTGQNDPLFGPQFHPPRVVNWRPHIFLPTGSPDLIPRCTLSIRS